jgi:outer membrane receptor protein involved in Fe transport
MKKNYILGLLIILISFGSAFAQKATIKGKVTDSKSKETLIGVNVVLSDNTGAATNIDGAYELKVEPGTIKVTFKYIGYDDVVKTLVLGAGETKTLDVVMAASSKMLDVVVVSAGKFEQKIEDITVSMEVINPSLVENRNTTTMETAVNQSPGVQIVDGEPQIRGGSGYSFGAGSRVMILVDDLPLLSGDAGRPSWGFLPVENLEQIEVIKGASSVLYGSAALSGAINIRTAFPKDKPQTKINFFSGMYSNPRNKEAIPWNEADRPTYTGMNFFHSRKIGNLDLVIGGNLFSDDKFIGASPEVLNMDRTGNNTLNINGVEYDMNNLPKDHEHNSKNTGNFERRARLNANIRYRSKKHEGLNYGVNLNSMKSNSASTLLMQNVNEGMYRSFSGSLTRTLQTVFNIDPFINYYAPSGEKHSLRTRVFYLDNANDNNQANTSTLYFGEYQFQKKFNKIKDFTMTSGVMSTYSVATSQLYAGNEDGTGSSTASNVAAYTQLDKKFWGRLTFSAGARFERFEINGVDESKPVFRSGVSARILEETYARASFGQGFRFPTIAEKFIRTAVGPVNIYPNTDLKSESSWNAEIGLKQGFKIGDAFKGYLDLAYFRQRIQNNIEFNFGLFGDPAVDPLFGVGFKSVNVGEVQIDGLDFSVMGGGKIGEVQFAVLAGYTYMNPVVLNPDSIYKATSSILVEEDDAQVILKYRFNHLIKADVEFTYKKFSLGGSVRYNSFMRNVDRVFLDFDSDQFSGDPGPLPTGIRQYRKDRNGKGDYIVDFRLSYQVNEMNKVAIIANNVLNREYMIRPLSIEAPRTLAVQYTLAF